MLIGHQFDEFFKQCTFRERDCNNATNFKIFLSPNFGNCFMFNSIMNEDDPYAGHRVTSMSGPAFGLTVSLFLNQKPYLINGQTQSAGARVVIHDPNSLPMVDEHGLDLYPNTQSRLSVQEVMSV